MQQTIVSLERRVEEDKFLIKQLQSDIESNNRKLGNSRVSDCGSDNGRSVKSEYQGEIGSENKRLEKKIRNLEYENSILKK